MSKKNDYISSRLREFEKILIDFSFDMGRQKRINPRISIIISLLLIHANLTQKRIKQLADEFIKNSELADIKKMKGFSIGTISTLLSVLVGTGFIQKQFISGTHTYTYSFVGNLKNLTSKGLEIGLESFLELENFLDRKKKQVVKLNLQLKEGAEFLSERIDEMIDVIEIHKEIFTILKSSLKDNSIMEVSNTLIKKEKDGLTKIEEIVFDPELYIIEEDILNEIISLKMFSARDPLFIKILGLFMTRKYLTQKTIKSITGISVGKISKELNDLTAKKLIEKVHITPKGKIIYGVDHAGLLWLKFAKNILLRFNKWEDKIEELRLELKTNKNMFRQVKVYTQINRITRYFLVTIKKYKKLLGLIDKVIENSN